MHKNATTLLPAMAVISAKAGIQLKLSLNQGWRARRQIPLQLHKNHLVITFAEMRAGRARHSAA
jgi:hypothetical protein